MRHARNHLESWMKGLCRLISQHVFSEQALAASSLSPLPSPGPVTVTQATIWWHKVLFPVPDQSGCHGLMMSPSVCWPRVTWPGSQLRAWARHHWYQLIVTLLPSAPDPGCRPACLARNPPSQNSAGFLFLASSGPSYLWCIANTFISCRKKTATNFLVVREFYLVWGIIKV